MAGRLVSSLALAAAVIAGVPATSGMPAVSAQAGAAAPVPGTVDLTPVGAIVGKAPIVVFGESSHWDFGVHDAANRMFRYLAENHGFRVFVLESAWGVDEVTQAFVESGRTEAGPQESFFLNAFGSPATIDTIRWMGEWNRAHPNDQVRFAGYQPEQPVLDFQALLKYGALTPGFSAASWVEKTASCKASNPEIKTELDFLGPIMKTRRGGNPGFPEPERLACLAAIDAFDAWLTARKPDLVARSSINAFREAQAHVLSLKTFYGLLMRVADAAVNPSMTPEARKELAREAYSKGDEARTAIFETLRDTRYAGRKMFLWMHNWHAARHADELTFTSDDGMPKGTISIGTRLAAQHQKDVVTFGSVVPCPRCTTKRDDALDAAFRGELGGTPAIIDLRNPAAAHLRLPLARQGSLIDPLYDAAMLGVILSRQYDALLYLPESDTVLDRRAKEKK